MRFMIIVKATVDSEREVLPKEADLAEMAAFHEDLHRAGVVLDAAGLKSSRHGFRVRYAKGKQTVVDGPFAETKELIAGYTIIEVKSLAEAKEWARRFPKPYSGTDDANFALHIEVRQLFELDDFVQGPGVAKFREIGLGQGPQGA